MDMRVESEFLAPSVQHAEETDFCAEMFGITRDFKKSFRTGAKQQIVDDLFILQRQWRQLTRQREDHVDVARGEKFLLTRGDPTVAGRGLTLRTVAVAAGVVRDGAIPAAGALIEMPAQCGGTTPHNGPQHFDVLPVEPVAISFDECVARGADEIGHLQGRPAHLIVPLFVFQLQRVQRTGGGVQMTFGKMQVDGGLFQIAMA